ncbi:MAG: hypothetical protein ACR2NM_09745 [Bythopirellula sp.]
MKGARASRGENELLLFDEFRDVETGEVEAGRRTLLAGGESTF